MDQDILLELNTLVLSLLGTNWTHNDYETQRENLNSQNTVWEKVDSRMAVDKFKNKYQWDGGWKLCCLTEEIKNIHLLFQNYPNCQDKVDILWIDFHKFKLIVFLMTLYLDTYHCFISASVEGLEYTYWRFNEGI